MRPFKIRRATALVRLESLVKFGSGFVFMVSRKRSGASQRVRESILEIFFPEKFQPTLLHSLIEEGKI